MTSRHPLTKILVISLYALTLFGSEAAGMTEPSVPPVKDLKKAAKIIVKLRRLGETAATAADYQTYRKLVNSHYPGLFVDISRLGASNLKTDLSTAAFLYEQVAYELSSASAAPVNCQNQMRELYRHLCQTKGNETRARFLWAKARLHTDWAAATLRFEQGDRAAETVRMISQIEAEREIDLRLAEEAARALKLLDEKVGRTSAPAELEQRERPAHLSFDAFSHEYRKAARTVDALLASLPRSPVYYQLQNARNSYHEGLFWWQKSYRSSSAVVSVNALAETNPLRVLGMEEQTVNQTVVSNWRNGRKYLQQTVAEIEKARSLR